MLEFQQQKVTSKKTTYFFKKHSGVPWTGIATLKRVFFSRAFWDGWWSYHEHMSYHILSYHTPVAVIHCDFHVN